MKSRIVIIAVFLGSIQIALASFRQPITNQSIAGELSASSGTGGCIKAVKLNFFQKLDAKSTIRKNSPNDNTSANKKARASLLYGLGAIVAPLLTLVPSPLAALTLPFSILAIIKGNKALKDGTTDRASAKAGRAIGVTILVLGCVLTIVAACMVGSGLSNMRINLNG